jgi:GTPase SAR1 family protein
MGPYNIAVWDLPGKENLRMLWPNFYRSIRFSGVVYMIDYEDKDTLGESVRVLHDLLSEEELAGTSLIIVANCVKKQQQEKVFDDDMDIKPGEVQSDTYIQQLTNEIKKNIYFDLINQEKKDIFICDIYDEKATQKDTDRISIFFKNYLSDLSK